MTAELSHEKRRIDPVQSRWPTVTAERRVGRPKIPLPETIPGYLLGVDAEEVEFDVYRSVCWAGFLCHARIGRGDSGFRVDCPAKRIQPICLCRTGPGAF